MPRRTEYTDLAGLKLALLDYMRTKSPWMQLPRTKGEKIAKTHELMKRKITALAENNVDAFIDFAHLLGQHFILRKESGTKEVYYSADNLFTRVMIARNFFSFTGNNIATLQAAAYESLSKTDMSAKVTALLLLVVAGSLDTKVEEIDRLISGNENKLTKLRVEQSRRDRKTEEIEAADKKALELKEKIQAYEEYQSFLEVSTTAMCADKELIGRCTQVIMSEGSEFDCTFTCELGADGDIVCEDDNHFKVTQKMKPDLEARKQASKAAGKIAEEAGGILTDQEYQAKLAELTALRRKYKDKKAAIKKCEINRDQLTKMREAVQRLLWGDSLHNVSISDACQAFAGEAANYQQTVLGGRQAAASPASLLPSVGETGQVRLMPHDFRPLNGYCTMNPVSELPASAADPPASLT